MLKKLSIGAAVLALPLTIIGVVGVSPAVGSVPVITANGSVTCTTLGGKIGFSPALHATGTTNSDTATVAVTLAGCTPTSTNLPAGSIIKGKASSTLTTTTTNNSANACGGLTTSRAVKLTVKWSDKNSSGVKLATLTNTVISFSGFDAPVVNGVGQPGFDLAQDSGGTASATGSFVGTDAGASSQANVFGKKTLSQLGKACGSATGLTALPVGGAGTLSDPSESVSG